MSFFKPNRRVLKPCESLELKADNIYMVGQVLIEVVGCVYVTLHSTIKIRCILLDLPSLDSQSYM